MTTGGSMDVDTRELRDDLTRHLAEVRGGRTITITDDGKPIAQLVPVGVPTAMERLIAEGRVTPAKRRKRPAPTPIKTAGPVSDLIDEQRR
ncbi:type II toxin-antitoxin system Phd/YefM family antitoxin [Kribbella qitaiheensis]|uniref:type II toxin-antitoxin system Phd/YefM family antitoxin n=1 Tax=Kribbella qitaiheensis TaxID=1544730 RepID=UPI00361EE224